jgi:very-short-patch-repair endonuclease
VSNDIEVVTNADKVLIYDKPISPNGLSWRALQEWWAEREGLSDEAAKKSLYVRLRSSLPQNSPPQSLLFRTFYQQFRDQMPDWPALIPEVWLHWDPRTVRERGFAAMARFRMDFLLLLPDGARIVIEVDGKHHYADPDGRASPPTYARMVAADRELRLAGYDVFRFGAAELVDPTSGRELVQAFFGGLFRKYRPS